MASAKQLAARVNTPLLVYASAFSGNLMWNQQAGPYSYLFVSYKVSDRKTNSNY